jgi:YrbI family 3-deoxy-D-manno-octulosonate 8-phosphate phosphatase
VSARAAKLGVPVLQGQGDKAAALRAWMATEGLDPSRVAYLGNDVNDLGCLEIVGWPVAVPDAHPLVLAAARVVLARDGGAGAVRDLVERVLRARDTAADVPSAPLTTPLRAENSRKALP